MFGRSPRERAPRARPVRRRLPLHKSLLGRLLAVATLVAACSVAATAWLAVQTTSGAIKEQQGQSLTDDAEIYDALLGHAAANPKWSGVQRTVQVLAKKYQRRIALTTADRRLIADSAEHLAEPLELPSRAAAIVDPLAISKTLAPLHQRTVGDTTDSIDPRAVGAFQLTAAESTRLAKTAQQVVNCLSDNGVAANVVNAPSGRPKIQVVGQESDRVEQIRCAIGLLDSLDTPTTTERAALAALNKLSDDCLARKGHDPVRLSLDLSWQRDPRAGVVSTPPRQTKPTVVTLTPAPAPAPREPGPEESAAARDTASCVDTARREQLSAHVSLPAFLFIGDPGSAEVPGFELSPANTARIAGVAALVLALTVGASVLAATRLVRPLLALTGAAQRMKDGERTRPVPVTTDNEIGRLAVAFNEMAAHRALLETQRRAMVSDVAHELRTPLSNIRGWLEGAQDGVADLDPAFVSSLLEEAVQLQHIIDDLQDLAEADAGALRLHREPLRMADLLGQVASAHQARAESEGVSLDVIVPGHVPLVLADPVRLRQAIGNLVSNAIRHSPRGGTVTLQAYCGGDRLDVSVTDTGPGIPAENLPYLFDRFWRAEKSRNRRTGGSGLGLAIVRKLAEAHGGSVDVESRLGAGATFTLRLPTAAAQPASSPDHQTTAI
ncbi:sensor histidine kinase [Streptomyces albipurpureus]|uniref:histidine kinase n=1 Tax=Streptomyces albipurpureus TaxID=2897419 RepID=A0ABT0UUK0_9ACTN|nr:HAMP domain-containing sensor histidine kinase [Streptomyces sp. CWNU-1]MCM2392254.1 HAMP domain-containing histidine kinase [Streptomyces sp. CWNU-1]